jgi:hypothetical protein
MQNSDKKEKKKEKYSNRDDVGKTIVNSKLRKCPDTSLPIIHSLSLNDSRTISRE